jgi:hypothetical protein
MEIVKATTGRGRKDKVGEKMCAPSIDCSRQLIQIVHGDCMPLPNRVHYW